MSTEVSPVTNVGTVALVGGGVMGETLLGTLRRAGVSDIVVAEPRADRARELSQTYGVTTAPAAEAVRGASLVLLLVKPQIMADVVADIAATVEPDALVVSFAAGLRIDTIAAQLPETVRVMRVMPNTPASIGQGMFGVSPGPGVTAEDLAMMTGVLAHGGRSVVIDESRQEALTAVSGSGPAYVFYLAEAMIAAGIELGLDADTASELTQQTLVGAAALLAQSPDGPAELRRQVTSPNGTTHAAITTFDEHGVAAGVRAGMAACVARAVELAEGP